MKSRLPRSLQRYQTTFGEFTAAQKVIAVLGTGALLLAAVLVFRWVAKPEYAPLFTNLSAADASAVVDKLDGTGVPYELTNGGTTVMVPKSDVYKTRITLSGEGLPSSSESGYSLLDQQDLSTSQFQEQVDFKRAMEGELAKTIEAMNGVNSAVVHLALPEKEVFSDSQADPTASVLVATTPGATVTQEQVQSIVHLVAASIEGMDTADVTVADSNGTLLSADGTLGGGVASSRDQYLQTYQSQMAAKVQNLLDRVLGPGNAVVEVTADLDFDSSVIETRKYSQAGPDGLAQASTKNSETYSGPADSQAPSGVVGPDGQMDTSATSGTGQSSYNKSSETTDNALDTTVERREVAPGSVNALHIAAVIDRAAAATNDPTEIEKSITSALGIQPERGDTVRVSVLPFDRTGEESAAAELEAQQSAAAKSERMGLFRNIAIGALVLFGLLVLWLRGRKRNKQRVEATSYVLEQLRSDQAARQERELENPASQLLSLEGAPLTPEEEMRKELVALVESQPEDVASLLRGWLVER